MRRLAVFAVLAAVGVLALTACSSGTDTSTYRVAAGIAGVGSLPRPASAWPEAAHDARFASNGHTVGPQTAAVRWRTALGGDATPGPVIAADGSILQATQAGTLHDLDAKTGKEVWSFDGGGGYGSDLSTSPAVLTGGTILWPGPANTLYALTSTGAVMWRERFTAQVLSPAVGGNNRVYVADLAGRLEALVISGRSHRVAWRLDVGGPDYASPSIGPNGTVYTVSDKDLVAVHDTGASGAIAWRFHAEHMIEVSNAVAADGTVVVGTNGKTEYGVGPDGRQRWSLDIGDWTYSSSTVGPHGLAYFGDNSGRVRTVEAATGHVVRTIDPIGDGSEKVWTSVAVDSVGDTYWGTTIGSIYGYDPHGRLLFRVQADAGLNSYPALGADGTLYIASTAGTLYAVGPTTSR